MTEIKTLLSLTALGLVCAAMAVAAEPGITVKDTGYVEVKHGKDVYMQREIRMDTGKAVFRLRTNGTAFGLLGGNWHNSELCTVNVNGEPFFGFNSKAGKKEGFQEKTAFKVTPGNGTVTVEAVQKGNKAEVTLVLTARAGDDKLGLTVKVAPKHKLRGTIVGFECYPSTMAPRDKLQRAAATTMRTRVRVSAGGVANHVTMDEGENWVFLFDKTYDLGTPTVGKAKGQGGCALFFVPDEIRRATIIMGAFHIDPKFYFGPKTTEMHFTVMDFRGRLRNADALKYLKDLEEKGHVPGKEK